jgi:mannose/fructose/N-acetylgalactosamine-specific phosphotransferase system component IIC
MSMLLDPLMMMMGSAIVGHLGTQQLAAVSMASLAVAFSSFMFSFLVFLTTPKVAAAAQQGDLARVSRIAANGIWLAAAIGIVTSLCLYLFAGNIVAGASSCPGWWCGRLALPPPAPLPAARLTPASWPTHRLPPAAPHGLRQRQRCS